METVNAKGIFEGKKGIVMPTYKEQAYELIKEAIIYQRFSIGEIYSQESICNELGISRTPVREALLELQKAGYIKFHRGRGISILPVTNDEVKSILEMRIYNERYSARLAARRITEADLKRLRQVLVQMEDKLETSDSEELYEMDRYFHHILLEAGKNIWLLKIVEDLRDNFLRFENRTIFRELQVRHQVLTEHKHIYDRIASRDEEGADRAMEQHLSQTYHRVGIQRKLD